MWFVQNISNIIIILVCIDTIRYVIKGFKAEKASNDLSS